MKRRAWLLGAVLDLFAQIALAGWPLPGGAVGGGPSGFLPSNEYLPRIQPLIAVFPQPDSSTSANAYEHWAYFDPSNPDNTVEWSLPLISLGGAHPYVVVLNSSPAGMTLTQAAQESDGQITAPRLTWTPTAAVTGQTNNVSVTFYSQEYQTDPTQQVTITFSVNTTASTSHYIFVNANTGNDSNSGTYNSPLLDLTGAFGSTYSTSVNPGAIVVLQATGSYPIPTYSDNTIVSTDPLFEMNTSTKPIALVGMQGITATVPLTNGFFASGGGAPDWFMANLTFSGYDSSFGDPRIFWMGGGGSDSRMTFDQNTWENPGYSTGTSNATGYFAGGSSVAPRQFIVLNEDSETNRESGNPGNNYGGASLYDTEYSVMSGNVENSPSADMDGAWYFKDDPENCEAYGNVVITAGYGHAVDVGQAPNYLAEYFDSTYNTLIGTGGIFLPQTGGYQYGAMRAARNSLVAGADKGLANNQSSYNLVAPPTSAPTTSTMGGSLPAGTYYYVVTAKGVSGESTVNAIVSDAPVSNEKSITTTGSTSAVTLTWNDTWAPSYDVYRGTSSGGENVEYTGITGNSFTDTGATGTSATPPTTQTAVSAYSFAFDLNAVQTTYSPTPPPSGAVITSSGNLVEGSGLLNSSGQLESAYSSYLYQVGSQIPAP